MVGEEEISEGPGKEGSWLGWQLATLVVLMVMLKGVYGVYSKSGSGERGKKTPYRLVKHTHDAKDNRSNKRIVAVLGGTGFVGTHVVNSLLETGEHRVYVLGRNFRDDRVNPKADALIQVDMTDLEGLCSAFQGVDTVIHTALALPTVHTSPEEVRKVNELGAILVLLAAQKCSVENLIFISGLQFKPPVGDRLTAVMLDCFKEIERKIIDASLISNLKTCVIRFGNMYGVHSPLLDKVLKGEMSRIPLLDNPVSFTPVEYAANAIIEAEKRLAENDERVTGNLFKVAGHFSTMKEFFTLPEWHLEVKHIPILVLKLLANFNYCFAKLTGWAPMGPELIPSIVSFFELTEEDVDNSVAEKALGIGAVPNIKEGVKAMIVQFKKNKALKSKI